MPHRKNRHIHYSSELHLRIKQAREGASLSQFDLCRILKVSRPVLSRIESGQKSPTIEQVEIIARATGINFEHLVLGTQPLQAALDQIDEMKKSYNFHAARIDKTLNAQLDDMRDSYIDRYGHPDQDYPPKQ